MTFLKKQSAGFFLTLIAIIFTIMGVGFYLINCNTDYFATYGVDSKVVVLMIFAILLELALIVMTELVGDKIYLDIIPVLSTVILIVAFITFVQSRVNSIASIMTFQNNAQTMADLSSAIIGMVLCFAAIVFCIISSFFSMVKE